PARRWLHRRTDRGDRPADAIHGQWLCLGAAARTRGCPCADRRWRAAGGRHRSCSTGVRATLPDQHLRTLPPAAVRRCRTGLGDGLRPRCVQRGRRHLPAVAGHVVPHRGARRAGVAAGGKPRAAVGCRPGRGRQPMSMEFLMATAIGALTMTGLYLILMRRTFPVIVGLSFLSYAVNVFLFTMGRLSINRPPIFTGSAAGYTDPL